MNKTLPFTTSPSVTSMVILALVLLIMPEAQGLEQPEYEVLHQDGKFEYRLYQPYLVAETEVHQSDSYGAASNEGFMRLFRYITGNNSSQSDIAMTAPVQQSRGGEEIDMTAPVQRSELPGGWRVAFMLPHKYTLDTAPIPNDERIRIRQVPGKIMAVVRYSGRWTEKNLAKFEARLMDKLNADGAEIIGAVESAAYNPPFTPPFMRRNEIMVEVSAYPEAAVAAVGS